MQRFGAETKARASNALIMHTDACKSKYQSYDVWQTATEDVCLRVTQETQTKCLPSALSHSPPQSTAQGPHCWSCQKRQPFQQLPLLWRLLGCPSHKPDTLQQVSPCWLQLQPSSWLVVVWKTRNHRNHNIINCMFNNSTASFNINTDWNVNKSGFWVKISLTDRDLGSFGPRLWCTFHSFSVVCWRPMFVLSCRGRQTSAGVKRTRARTLHTTARDILCSTKTITKKKFSVVEKQEPHALKKYLNTFKFPQTHTEIMSGNVNRVLCSMPKLFPWTDNEVKSSN